MKRDSRIVRGAWAVAAIAGLCAAPAATAQFARAVNPDLSVTAEDVLLRVRELGEAGNIGESLRVLQQLLETDADRMIAVRDESDPGRFESVRAACHRALLARPELLGPYRIVERENARRLLEMGEHRAVERSRFLTEAGYEAALRVAQEDLEAGRFEAARLRLVECESHPDANGPLAKDRARLALEVARQLGREDVRTWAQALAAGAGVEDIGGWAVREASARYRLARTGLDAQPAVQFESIATKVLNSVSPSGNGLAEAIIELEESGDGVADAELFAPMDTTQSSMFGASVGGMFLVSDGYTIACLDAATLGVRWRTTPPVASPMSDELIEDWAQPMMSRSQGEEEIASVAAGSGIVVAPVGSLGDEISGVARSLHGLDIASGRVLWSLSVAEIDRSLAGGDFTGPVVIEGDVAIVCVARSGLMRRESELHMVGVDLFKGTVRWSRRLGSVGVQPWLRREAMPEGPALDRGIVYRADDLGVLGAYEASTGRPLWVRQLSTARVEELQFRVAANAGTRPYQVGAPVVDGSTVICHDATGNKIVRVDAKSGKLIGSRDASAFGEARYMLRAGDHLVVVGDRHVSFVKIAEFETGLIRMAARFGEAGIVGRCVVSGDRLLVPIAGGIAIVDPKDPGAQAERAAQRVEEPGDGTDAQRGQGVTPDIALARAGNPMVVELGAGVSSLIVAERSLVSTYLRWEKAEQILNERATAEPDDASPMLTMIELGARAGRYGEIPALADRVLALADRDPLAASSASARASLFQMLSTMARKAKRLWLESGAQGAVPPELLSRILGAMGRSAETPEELVTHAFAEAWLHEIQGDPSRAIEAYQSVLADSRLASVQVGSEDRSDLGRFGAPVTSSSTAGAESGRRILAAIKQAGIAAYVGFEDEALRAFEAAGEDAAELVNVADRYPGSLAALKALERAVAIHDREAGAASKRPDGRALELAARGLELSRAQASAAREDAWPMAGLFLARVVREMEDRRPESALRLLRAVEADRPDLELPGTRRQTVSAAAAALSERVWSRAGAGDSSPVIGSVLSPAAQPMEGWFLEPSSIRSETFASREAVVMSSLAEAKIGLWSRDASGERFVAVWTRETGTRHPTPILVTPEETLLFVRPDEADAETSSARIECIDNATGRVRWESAELADLLGGGDSLPRPGAGERVVTPMEGAVFGSDVIVAEGGSSRTDACVWLVARNGAFASLRIGDGAVLAKGVSGVTHVYDVDTSAGRIAIAGATYRSGLSATWPRVEVRNLTGSMVGAVEGAGEGEAEGAPLKLEFGTHVRFVRATPRGDVLIGSAAGLALVGAPPGAEGELVERWTNQESSHQSLAGAWITPDQRTLVAMDGQARISALDPDTGATLRRLLETTSRVALPLEVRVLRGGTGGGDLLALTSTNGLVVIGPDGTLVGADGITPKGILAMPALTATRAVCVEAVGAMQEFDPDAMSRVGVALLDLPYARVVSTATLLTPGEVMRVVTLDDTVLVSARDSTIVIDAPRE